MDEMDIFEILGETRPHTPPPPSLTLTVKADTLGKPNLRLPLETLPMDILCLIFEHLCPHCYSAPSGPINPVAYAKICREALRALSVSCKKLSLVALSFLAHRPCSRVPLKTLISALERNPHLAAEVKEPVLCLYQETSHEDFEFFKQVAQRLPTSTANSLDFESVKSTSLARNAFGMRLMLALTSHPNALTLQIREFRDPESYRIYQEEGDGDEYEDEDEDEDEDDEDDETDEEEDDNDEIEHGILNERSANPINEQVRNFGRDSLFHGIRHLTLDHQSSAFCFENPPLASILAATVNLRHLKIRNALGGNLLENYPSIDFRAEQLGPALKNLETLEIDHCTFTNSSETSEFAVLAKIIACAPKLRTFKFRAQDNQKHPHCAVNMVSPVNVLSALLPCRATLEHISLNFLYTSLNKEYLKGFHFNQFTTLKALTISENSACDCRSFWSSRNKAHCLAKVIPPQLEHLSIVFESFANSADHISHIADKFATGRLPMLKCVTLVYLREFETGRIWRFTKQQRYSIYARMETMRIILEEAGVHANFAGPIFHWLKVERGEELSSIEVVDE